MALLEAAGLKASLWPGLDMQQQGLVEGERLCRFCCILLTRGAEITVGRVGCYFSHVRLMKHLLSQKVERALVLECDAQPQEGLLPLLEDIEELDASYELIFLCHRRLSAYRKTPSLQLAGGRNLHLTYGPFDSIAGYVISRTAIERLLPRMLTMRRPADHILTNPYLTGVASYAVLPRAIEAETEPSIRTKGPRDRPYRPEASVWASLDQALCFLLKKAMPLVNLIYLGIRVYRRCRKSGYILRNKGAPRP